MGAVPEQHDSEAARPEGIPIEVEGRRFDRLPLRTHVLSSKDDPADVLEQYAAAHYHPGDVIFISETAVAIMQGRARNYRGIQPGWMARRLSKLVTKSQHGVGLRSPYAMQVAIELSGVHRILAGCAWHVVGRLLGRKGWFYAAAGPQARMMDAEHTMGVKDYYECVVPGPADPPGVCRGLKQRTGMDVAIVDVNDIFPPWCIASTLPRAQARLLERCLTDNPLGQGDELTPMGIWRELKQH
jgi:F420-0:gamma-glutamyl ligase-like protein